MIRLELTNQDFYDIAEALDDPETSDKNKTKLLVIGMHHEGAKQGFIAKVLNLHSNTITNHLKEYSKGGLSGTLEDRYYRPSSSLEPFPECLKCSFRAAPVADAKQALARIKSLTGVGLIERLWKLTKRRCLTNRYYADFGAFCGAIDKCLEDLFGPLKKELTSLMTLNFQFFQNHKS